jgi:Ca-activated chloride channel family protein
VDLKSLFIVVRWVLLLACSSVVLAQPQVFKVDTTLQSIAVQVADKQGNQVHGLTAPDFTLLEDGHPQRIAFFEAESEPISLAILLDVARSMDFGGKLERARALLASLIRDNRPEDEIFFMPFADAIGPFEQLTSEQRLRPPAIARLGHSGSALYDALASALCHMRTAKNLRQAVVVITDGMDQQSRLKLEQLVDLVRSSSCQVFMVGLYNQPEYEVFRQRRKTVTIAGLREVDNPLVVFERLSKESGAESFFPKSAQGFKRALDRIWALLKAEYTLAYYPQKPDKVRNIDVRVTRGGVRISARRSVGSESGMDTVRFTATGCAVSPIEHPYRWETRVTSSSPSPMVYHEDFSDLRSGWPNHIDPWTSARYVREGFELYRIPLSAGAPSGRSPIREGEGFVADMSDTVIAAYGPWWSDFRASAWLEPGSGPPASVGLVFDFNESGYYAFLLTRFRPEGWMGFTLVKGNMEGVSSVVIPQTRLVGFERYAKHKLSVECNRGQITLAVDDHQVASMEDVSAKYGLVGFGVFGDCRAWRKCRIVVNDLLVQAIP